MRQLASIQRIKQLDPIPGADAIVRATVLGWHVVVKKGEFAVGDLCVYCEIDSLLPDRPEFEFLRPRNMRIRTARLRGQVSQGICFPLTILPRGAPPTEGSPVTELLGIVKYEPPMPASLSGVAKGLFPSFIPKTDETRVQVLGDVLTSLRGTACFVTEKLDGSSATYFIRDGEFGVCSRSLELREDDKSGMPPNSFWKVARQLDIEGKLRVLNRNLAIQGELIGEGIQGNKYRLRGQIVRFFNVFDIDKSEFLGFGDFTATIREMGLETVPILNERFTLTDDIPALIALAEGQSKLYDVMREGIVIRPLNEQRVYDLGRVSFKAISPRFLLKFDE